MAFRFFERPNSRESTHKPPSLTQHWCATGTTNDGFVRSYALAATPNITTVYNQTVYRQDIRIDPAGHANWDVVVPYSEKKKENGQLRVTFDTTGGSVHIKASKQTVAKFPSNAPDHKQLIGVRSKGGSLEVEGADIVIPALKVTAHFTHPAAVITMPQIKNLARWTGNANSGSFLTFAAGEVLFLGAKGSEGTDADTEVGYDFAMSENIQNQVIGAITGIKKDGWDIAWIAYKPNVDGGNPVAEPQYVYIERVYNRIDLGLSLGFGG